MAFELLGVRVAPGHQCGPLGDPDIGLTQRHPVFLGLAAKQTDRLVHQPGIGRDGNVLGLHRNVHCHPLQILRRQRASLVRHREALLQQGRQLLLAKALAPAGQRRALEWQLMLETLLTAEVLVIGVFQPARAQHLIGQVLYVLQDEQPGHQQRRRGGCPGLASHTEPKRPSKKSQSISCANRTHGGPRSMI